MQIQDLPPIKSILPSVMQSTQPPQTKPTSSTGREPNVSGARLKIPPLVVPKQSPETLIKVIFGSPDDYADMCRHLGTYHKTRAEWDHYRQKIPDDLLKKFKKLLEVCRESGYIAPEIVDGEMRFRQVISKNRNADQCTLCSLKIVDGSCRGKGKYINNLLEFVQCWK